MHSGFEREAALQTTSGGAPGRGGSEFVAAEAARVEFFDRLAGSWDEEVAGPAHLERLRAEVMALDLGGGETVLDLGCGTGNLTVLLAGRVGAAGRVWAVDISPAMLERAREKLGDNPRVEWVRADAGALPIPDESLDAAVCLSAWPHFRDPRGVAAELHRILRPGGVLHILHLDGRETINELHRGIGGAVVGDLLPPAEELKLLLEEVGFEGVAVRDEPDSYRVTVVRRRG